MERCDSRRFLRFVIPVGFISSETDAGLFEEVGLLKNVWQ